jgi:MoxR-like ATPase
MQDVAERFRIRDKSGAISARAALKWVDAAKISTKLRGRKVLVHEDDAEAALQPRETHA